MRAALLTLLLASTLIAADTDVGTCPANDERCIACNGSKCVECAGAYLSPEGKCIPPTTLLEYCAQYKSNNTCAYCVSGYYTTTAGKCVKIPVEGCAELASATQCAVCQHGILVKNGVCSSDNKCGIANCDMCMLRNNVEVCAKCAPGYAVLINKGAYSCRKESGDINNCLYLNSNNENACAVCDYNYYMKNQRCDKSTQYKLDSGVQVISLFAAACLMILFK